jgi:predicted HTH domain antitoxin
MRWPSSSAGAQGTYWPIRVVFARSFLGWYAPTMLATLEIPEQVLNALGADPASAARKIRLLAALKLYELGRLSSGAAAALAGLARVEFLASLGEYGVSPFQLRAAELDDDLENARRATNDD